MRKFLVGFFILLGISSSYAQAEGIVADHLFDNFEYSEAIHYYVRADELSAVQEEKLAYSYYSIKDFKNAADRFKVVVNREDYVDPSFYYFYGNSLKNDHQFDEAKKWLSKALEIDSTDYHASNALRSIQVLESEVSKTPSKEVVVLEGINNGASTFSPQWYKDGVVFCSELKIDSAKRRPIVDVGAYADVDKLHYGLAERPLSQIYYLEVDEDLNVTKSDLIAKSEKYHISSFFIQGDEVYFTKIDVNRSWDPSVKNHPRIFNGKLNSTDKTIDDPERTPVKKLSAEVGAGHPCLSSDGKTMYFSSDRPGGFGGADLYRTTLDENGKWTEPENLGSKINTKGDELYPTINGDFFYFSSDGHPGYGGLDVFKLPISGLTKSKPTLIQAPINSEADDYGVIVNPADTNQGFFTSNRFGGSGDDDLYMFKKRSTGILVQGTVRDINGDPVANALVKIYDENGNEVAQVKTDENGNYSLEVEEVGDYELVATIPGYGDKEPVSITEDWDSDERIDLTLEPMLTAQGQVKNEDGSPAANVEIELRDDKGNVIYSGMTDEDGYYQFPLEEDETYTAFATDGNLAGEETFTTDSSYDPLEDTDIQLGPVHTVQGVVQDEDGNPVANALVKIYDENGNEVGQVRTDENGEYSIPIYEEGDYEIVATIPGYGDIQQIVIDENWDDDQKIIMTLEPMLTAQGVVKNEDGSPAGNVFIELKDEDGNVIYSGRTDENGYYQFPLEEDKTYTAFAEDGIYSGKETFTTDENYDPLEDTDIILGPGAFVEGIVLNEDGSPASNADVKLYDNEGNLISTTMTDENGEYHFDLKNDENYQIIAETDGYQAVENIYTGDNYNSDDKLMLNLEPVGKESFALVQDNESNEGIAGVKVILVDKETGKKVVTTTDSEGKFVVNISPNHDYNINLEKDGYYPKTVKIKAGKLPEKVDLNQMGDFGMDYAGYDVKKIYFELDRYKVTKESAEQLDKVVALMKANPKAVLTIKSYADCRGPAKYNVSLSWKRSKAVKDYLINKGVSKNRILTESYGATNFVNNCATPEACSESEHALNRRSEFEIDFNK